MRKFEITIEDHNYAYIHKPYPEIIQALTVKFRKYDKRKKEYYYRWHRFVDGGQFYTGMIPYLKQTLPDDEFIITDNRIFPEIDKFNSPQITQTLRKYQIEYVMEAIKRDRAILKAETGAGKTLILATLVDTYPFPSLVIASHASVAEQVYSELRSILPHKKISRDFKDFEDPTLECFVGLPMSILKRYRHSDLLQRFKLLCMDEAHTSPAQNSTDLIIDVAAPYRFGFTATPEGRSDRRDLVIQGLFGEILEYTKHVDLKAGGYHPEMDIQMYYNNYSGNYPYMEEVLFVHNPVRNKLIADIALKEVANGGKVLILTRRKEHGRILKKLIKKSVHIDGDSSMEQRENAKRDIMCGKRKVLIASQIFAQGIDIPHLTLGINAAGGRADIINKQRAGRLARPFEGKVKRYVDFIDDYSWTTQNHSVARLAAYLELYQRVRIHNIPPNKEQEFIQKAKAKQW